MVAWVMRTASSLLEELRAVDESTAIEAKTASKIDRSVVETVCAFANEPGLGGGYVLLGVAESTQLGLFFRTYDVVGVRHPEKLQADLASQCASVFNLAIRPQLSTEVVEGRTVVVAFVPELSPAEKPLYFKNLGLPRGAHRRVGATDQEGTEDDLIALYHDRKFESLDSIVVRDATLADIDPEALRVYRELRREVNSEAEELTWSDPDLLRALNAATFDGDTLRPTVAGILLFGSAMALRRCFPMMRIDYVRVPGKIWVENPDRRFDTVEIRAPLILAVRRAIAAIRDDLPASFRLPEGELIRADETILPIRVLREALVNAVMHRSYRIHGAIQILRYANRIEIRNPGHSLKAEEQLGLSDEEARALVFVRELGAVNNAVYREINCTDTLQSSAHLRRLRDLGILEMRGSGSRTYYVGGPVFTLATPVNRSNLADLPQSASVDLTELGADLPQSAADLPQSAGKPSANAADLPMPAADLPQSVTELTLFLPPELQSRLTSLGQRPRTEFIQALIVDLCAVRPWSAAELGHLLGERDPKNLKKLHLTPMKQAGKLAYLIPEMPNHPQQKYVVANKEQS